LLSTNVALSPEASASESTKTSATAFRHVPLTTVHIRKPKSMHQSSYISGAAEINLSANSSEDMRTARESPASQHVRAPLPMKVVVGLAMIELLCEASPGGLLHGNAAQIGLWRDSEPEAAAAATAGTDAGLLWDGIRCEASPCGLCVVDVDGAIVAVNVSGRRCDASPLPAVAQLKPAPSNPP